MSNQSHVTAALSLVVALPTGILAAFGSQASSADYRTLFIAVVGLTMLSVSCTAVYVFTTRGRARYIPVPVAGLAIVGCIEFGVRLLGVRLLG